MSLVLKENKTAIVNISEEEINGWHDFLGSYIGDSFTNIELSESISDQYKFDFYGLMEYLGVNKYLWYPNMAINGYSSPTDYKGSLTILQVYDDTLMIQKNKIHK